MVEDYIKRSDALKLSVSIIGKLFSGEFDINQEIQKIPSADVAEVKHGKWLAIRNTGLAFCKCGYMTDRYSMFNFCPNCGADMREANDEI